LRFICCASGGSVSWSRFFLVVLGLKCKSMPIVSRATPASGRKLHPQEELPDITNVAIKVDKLLEKQECLEGFQFGKG
jgi:hypothetical protein